MNLTNQIDDMIRYGRMTEVQQMISKYPWSLKARTDLGETLLHRAAFYGQLPLMKFFVQHGLRIDQPDNNGFTPLHEAVRSKNYEAVLYLVDSNADLEIRTRHNRKTARELSHEYGTPQITKLLEDRDRKLQEEKRRKDEEARRQQHLRAQQEALERQRLADEAEARKRPQWVMMPDETIALVTQKNQVSLVLTEIFNFKRKTYILKTENTATKAEAVYMKTFSEFGDDDFINEARDMYVSMGGSIKTDLLSPKKVLKPKSA